MTTVQFGSSSHFRQWNLHGNISKTPCIGQVSIATVQLLLWLKSYSFHVFVKKSTKMPWSLIIIKDGWKGVKTSATHPLLWTLHNQHELYVTTRGGSRIFRGGGQLKKWGQFGPFGPKFRPSTGHYRYFGSHFCLSGPPLRPKISLSTARSRNFYHKIQCIGPKSGRFFLQGRGPKHPGTPPLDLPLTKL